MSIRNRDKLDRNKVQHDLRFTDASRVEHFPLIGIPEIKNDALHPALLAYQDSIESVRIMSLLPQAVVKEAVDHLLVYVQATENVLQKPVMDDSDLSRQEEVWDEYGTLMRHFFDGREKVRATVAHDLVMYNKIGLVNAPLTKGGFYAMLEAEVIGIWTAFDALTTDLCIAVVRAKPRLLDKLDDRRATLSELRQHVGDDWIGRIPDLLKAFVRFDSFKATVEAYKKLFCSADIQTILNSPGATLGQLVRNQLTHDSGLVTANFQRQAKQQDAHPWQAMAIGERLALDGRNVGQLCEGVIACGNDLILAVDKWLHLPPTRPAAK